MEYVFWFVILIGVLIFAHEAGHFLFARLFRVKVLTFSLGFGPPIRIGKKKASFQPGETEYRIAWFPVGGFVRMLGDDPSQEIAAEDRERAFLTQPAWKRFFIILGGPLFSILLAIPIFFVERVIRDMAPAPVVGQVIPDSPAAHAGIRAGDHIRSIGREATQTWEDVDEAVQSSEGHSLKMEVEDQGTVRQVTVQPRRRLDPTGLELLGDQWEIGVNHARRGRRIGVVSPTSPAGKAGLQSWDELVSVAGQKTTGWTDIVRNLEKQGVQPVDVTAIRADKVAVGAVSIVVPVFFETRIVPLPADQAPELTWHTASAYFGLEPLDLYISDVLDGKPAQKLGLKGGDKIVAVMGRPIQTWDEFTRAVVENVDKSIPVKYRRQEQVFEVQFTPQVLEEKDEFKQTTRKPGFGVSYEPGALYARGEFIERPNRIGYALRESLVRTFDASRMIVMGFVRLFQGRVSPQDALGGPIMIFQVAGKSAEKGLDHFLYIMALISVMLGLVNLLPIPILDGGHIAFIFIEVIRRRPLSMRAREMASYVGLVILLTLIVFATYNDVLRTFFS